MKFIIHAVWISLLKQCMIIVRKTTSKRNVQPEMLSLSRKHVMVEWSWVLAYLLILGIWTVTGKISRDHVSAKYCNDWYHAFTCKYGNFVFLLFCSNVLHVLDQWCSGRYHCRVKVTDLVDFKTCTEDLTSYLQARYTCESGEFKHSLEI